MITGQVGLVPAANNWASWGIVWATGSAYTHVVVAISETHCVSAEPGPCGARIRPISDYPDTVWSRFRLTPRQRRAIVSYAGSKLRTPYSRLDYLAAGVATVTKRRTPDWLRTYLNRRDKLICSHLALLALKAGGISLRLDDRPTASVIPGDFGKYFVTRGWADRA